MHELLITISSEYINSPLDDLDTTIHTSIQKIGNLIKVDRVHIHDYDFNKNECSLSYEWCQKGIPPTTEESQKVPLDAIMELVAGHFKGLHLSIPNVMDMEEGMPKTVLLSQGVKSVLTVPMILDNNCVGFVGFDSVVELRNYSADEISSLKLFADMTVNFMSRAKDQKRLNLLLEKMSLQNKRLMDFSHLVSHNIRGAASSIKPIVDLLYEEPTKKEYFDWLYSTVHRLDKSISNANSLLHFDSSSKIFEKEKCNIASSVRNVIKLHDKLLEEKEIKISNTLPSNLTVMAIPAYLESIFHNLLTNAIKYGTSDKSKIIKITYKKLKDWLSIKVTDFGTGIDLKKHEKRLFKVGARFHSDGCNSSGMGLFMTKHQIEAMGGKIRVKSEVGSGSAFEISLPIT